MNEIDVATAYPLPLVFLLLALTGCTPALPLRSPPALPPWQQTDAYVPGNAVEVLANGPATYRAMHAAIAGSRHHIHVETYILCEDPVGRRFTDHLIERHRSGVSVRLVYDSHGTTPCASQAFLAGLEQQGLELLAYNPPSDDALVYPLDYQRRDHRKLLIVDGRVVFTGGINFDDVYATSPRRSSKRAQGWRDTNVRIEGPAVAGFQQLFLQRWRAFRPLPELPGSAHFPTQETAGEASVRLVSSRGGGEQNEIFGDYLAAIGGARERIWLTQSYFTPEPNLMRALTAAATRGVDVRLMLPGFSDVPLLHPIARSSYQSLLEAGVRLYERHDAFVHAKTAVVDGRWSTVGSTNLDYRSLVHNDEANAMVLDPAVASEMEELFLNDVVHAREITLDAWRQRPLKGRMLEWLSLLFAYWL